MAMEHPSARVGADVPHVFVTYSHDTPEHRDQVREFCTFLRRDAGIDIHLDQWADDGPRDWSMWAGDQLREADFIIAIASPAYKRRAEGLAPPDEGRGQQYESAILRDQLTGNQQEWVKRILPVVLPGGSIDDLPSFLCPHSRTHYVISEFTLEGVTELLAAISRVAKHPAPERGRFTGNPYAELHARLLAEENAAKRDRPVGMVNNGFSFGGTVYHQGDNVIGDKHVYPDRRP